LKKLETFGTRNTLSSVDSPTRHRRRAPVDFRRAEELQPEAAGVLDTTDCRAGRITRDVKPATSWPSCPQSAAHLHLRHTTRRDRRRQSGSNAGNWGRASSSRSRRIRTRRTTAPLPASTTWSGTALTIELARAFSQSGLDFDATLVLMCHGRGAGPDGRQAARAKARDLGPHRCRAEQRHRRQCPGGNGTSTARRSGTGRARGLAVTQLARSCSGGACVRAVAHRAAALARRSAPRGGHSAYNQYGFAAVGFRESREDFGRQHDPRDTFDGLGSALAQNARVNAAAAATLAPPPAPGVLNERGQANINRAPPDTMRT
jgi:hypothetical protein